MLVGLQMADLATSLTEAKWFFLSIRLAVWKVVGLTFYSLPDVRATKIKLNKVTVCML